MITFSVTGEYQVLLYQPKNPIEFEKAFTKAGLQFIKANLPFNEGIYFKIISGLEGLKVIRNEYLVSSLFEDIDKSIEEFEKNNHITSLEVMNSDYKQFVRHIQNGVLDYALTALRRFVSIYGVEVFSSFKEYTLTHKLFDGTKMNLTPFFLSVTYGHEKLVAELIKYGANIDDRSTSENNPVYDNLTPLMYACMTGVDIEIIQMLINNKANLLHVNRQKNNIISVTQDPGICKVILQAAKDKGCIDQLICLENEKGKNAYETACMNGRPEILELLLEVENFNKLIIAKLGNVLHLARFAYFENLKFNPDKSQKFDKICLFLRKFKPTYKGLDFEKNTMTLTEVAAYHTLYKEAYPYDVPITKEQAVKKAIAQFYSIVCSPLACRPYYDFLDKEFLRYTEETNQKLGSLESDSYIFITIMGLWFAIPMSTQPYVGIKKFQAFKKFLQILLGAKKVYKFIGHVPEHLANEIYESGDLVFEDQLGMLLFHSEMAHMVQCAILKYAIQHGKVSLAFNATGRIEEISILDILHGLVSQQRHDKTATLWIHVLDSFYLPYISFSHPHRVASSIMHDLKLKTLSKYFIDTFCKGINKLLHVYNTLNDSVKIDLDTFITYMNDMHLGSIDDASYLHPISIKKQRQKSRVIKHTDELNFAIVERTFILNENFKPKEFPRADHAMHLEAIRHLRIFDPVYKIEAHPQNQFHIAASQGCTKILKIFLEEYKVNINTVCAQGGTALIYAALNGHTETVEFLLKHNADINVMSDSGRTALHCACQNNHTRTIHALLKYKPDVNAAEVSEGVRAFHIATKIGNIEVAKALLQHGGDINAPLFNGAVLIHVAAQFGHTAFVEYLLGAYKANINATCINGATPLYYAAKNGHFETVKLLVTHGAKVNTPLTKGKTPSSAAHKRGHKKIVFFLNQTDNNSIQYTPCQSAFFKAPDSNSNCESIMYSNYQGTVLPNEEFSPSITNHQK